MVSFLLEAAPVANGTNDAEKKDVSGASLPKRWTSGAKETKVSAWSTKSASLAELEKQLSLRVYIADGLQPTIADFRLFALTRDQIVRSSSWLSLLLTRLVSECRQSRRHLSATSSAT